MGHVATAVAVGIEAAIAAIPTMSVGMLHGIAATVGVSVPIGGAHGIVPGGTLGGSAPGGITPGGSAPCGIVPCGSDTGGAAPGGIMPGTSESAGWQHPCMVGGACT